MSNQSIRAVLGKFILKNSWPIYQMIKWAKELLTYLEAHDTEADDVFFQSELFWADFNSAKKPIQYSAQQQMRMSKPRKVAQ